MRPDQKRLLGTVTPMKGRHNGTTADGMSKVYHYDITGGARLHYRFNRDYRGGDGDEHCVVQIVSISLGSH